MSVMKEKNIFVIKTIKLLAIILLYYIVGSKNLFLYVLSLSLYKIFSSFFENMVFSERLSELDNHNYKNKLYKALLLTIICIGIVFLIISIIVSYMINLLVHIDNTLLIFIFMGLSVIMLPLLKIMVDYYNNLHKNTKYIRIIEIYYGFEITLFLIIAILVFRIFNVNENMAIALLYLAKIISGLLLMFFMYGINKGKNCTVKSVNINYYKELKRIIINNSYKSVVAIVKNSYYYISIIILYLVLSTRYNYIISDINEIIVFVYFYAFFIVEYLIYMIKWINKK